jgi:hypothetical protein
MNFVSILILFISYLSLPFLLSVFKSIFFFLKKMEEEEKKEEEEEEKRREIGEKRT